MKTNTWKPLFIGAIGASMVLVSCGDDTATGEESNHNVKVDTAVADTPIEPVNTVYYSVPTPNELFNVLKNLNMPFNASLMNPPENVSLYTESMSQSLNFGVYSADLAMAASFEASENTLAYFKTIRKLGDVLNINTAFDETVFKRLEENISSGKTDSLTVLSNETYYDAYSYLEENQRGSTLALIVIGGWVESIHIMANSDEFVEGSDFAKRLADQRLTMENLMGFLMQYQEDESVAILMEELIPIDEFFMNLEVLEGEAITTTETDGVYVLTGGEEVSMSAADFAIMKTLVSDLRTSIINAEL